MIRNLKQKIKSQMEKKYDACYFDEWNQKTCSYEEWLKKQHVSREEMYNLEGYQKLRDKVTVIFWDELEDLRGFEKENWGDIVVFVQEEKGFLEETIDIITSVFYENPEVQVVYGDEDEINYNETVRMNPWFKPDYSPDTLLSYYWKCCGSQKRNIAKGCSGTGLECKGKNICTDFADLSAITP